MDAVNGKYIPELVNRFFDTLTIQKGISKILMDISTSSLQVIFGLILLSLYHPFFILFSCFLLILVFFMFRMTIPKGIRSSNTESKYKYEVAHWLEELGRNMETFRLAGKSDLPLKRTNELVTSYLDARESHFRTLLLQFINLVGFKILIAAGLLIIGGLLVLNQQMNIGQFVASEIIIITVLNSIEKLIINMETTYDVLTALEKIGQVTDLPLEEEEGAELQLENKQGLSVQLKNINFSFENDQRKLLNNLNINIVEGQKVCLTGYSGSGKTLLLQFLSGLFNGYQGQLLYNNLPLGNLQLESLRASIGDNLAKEEFFSGTLMENICLMKKDVVPENVYEICEILGLSEYIGELPKGFNTLIMTEGMNIPKQIRTKIMLARCFTGNPKLILLEDNFNSMLRSERDRMLDYLLSQKMDCCGRFQQSSSHPKI